MTRLEGKRFMNDMQKLEHVTFFLPAQKKGRILLSGLTSTYEKHALWRAVQIYGKTFNLTNKIKIFIYLRQ